MNRSSTMGRHIVSLLLLILTVETGSSAENRFFISAPNVFHVGVREKVFVQMGKLHLNHPVTLHLEHESSGTVVSAKETVYCANEWNIKTVELKIDSDLMSRVPQPKYQPLYLLVVAESPSFDRRKSTKVLVSKHRGYIFIQTNQPAYNPTQQVHYRVFTLDHMFRPHEEMFHVSVFNAAGNRIMKSLNSAKGGLFKNSFPIPDVSEMGTWKISAHFDGDSANVVSREFKVQTFVLPSFGVEIKLEQNFILLNTERVVFTISAAYTHGEKVTGAYHCKFGVGKKPESHNGKTKTVFVKGLEVTGSVQDGTATVSVPTAKINEQLQKEKKITLADLHEKGAQIYLGVFVTNIESGEMQEAEEYLPIVAHKYTMDLSRTRSYLPPGYPLDVVVILRLPGGSPAIGVPVRTVISGSSGQNLQTNTDQEGAVYHTFNIGRTAPVTIEVTAEGLQQSKTIERKSSSSGSDLYISFSPRVYSVKDFLSVTYNTINGPTDGFIYYMVLSRGSLIKTGHLQFGTSVKDIFQITHDMVPSFRLIGYFYNTRGDIISDSVWVDVRDECEIKVKVEAKGPFNPGRQSVIDFDLHGQEAKVALLAVDKAFYALNADNKLTAKQVFSAMQSYDLGCSYGGGRSQVSTLKDAGLAFVTHSESHWRRDFHCDSQSSRKKRSVDLNQEMMAFRSNISNSELECCDHGFSLIPMTLTCQERAKRISLVKRNQACAEVFLKCCLEAERLRQKKIQEEAERGLSRTASVDDIEDFFLDVSSQYIRRIFPPSFAFTEFEVKGKKRHNLLLPDSITTWEIQVITLSAATGLCVVKPSEIKATKRTFVSLRLPYSVKKYEQIFISPVIYNYGQENLEVAVHMEQSVGLCSPGSATKMAFVNITVKPESSQFVFFSAVPMITGEIPIKIRLYDLENERGIDAIEKRLNVLAEGLEQREGETHLIKLDGKGAKTLAIDGTFPDEIVPESRSNIFISAEENEFQSQAANLLSPETVAKLIVLPTGCLEQTMVRLAPTASALRYLDLSDQWFNMPAGARDDAMDKIMKGVMRILTYKKPSGAYGAWSSVPSSNWVTALVVKVLSLVAQRQTRAVGESRTTVVLPDEITHTVRHLLSVQERDGSFTDPHPVLHREALKGKDQVASMTAFITLSLHVSLQFLPLEMQEDVRASISRSTTYLVSQVEELQHPYAVAITAYCLSVPEWTEVSSAWTKLQAMVTEGKDGCYLWTTDNSTKNQERADGITVETTAYALLTAVALKHSEWADKAACWLITQENYFGGYKSSQDTIMALEALAEYALKRPISPGPNVIAEFTVKGKVEIVRVALENKGKVEADLKKFVGHKIDMRLSGKGDVKLKIVKAYYLLGSNDGCTKLSIRVTVEGKVKYTPKVMENYDYYDDYDANKETELLVPQSGTEESDTHDRKRRDVDGNLSSLETVTYRVCVSHNLNYNLTGMAIADITLLSGFEAVIENLDRLKQPPEQYISHYEIHDGRVLLYFNELFELEECVSFDAKQTVPIGLLQPAPAVFYDYYEPNQKCTVFYSAPRRSTVVSKLCSEDVCQCAERPCHKMKMTFKSGINGRLTKNDRLEHACFFPVVDYAYIIEVVSVSAKTSFDIYNARVMDVLRSNGDRFEDGNYIRVFVKRHQCKGELNSGRQYLIMGKDGSTTDSNGAMQYLLESNTWLEQKPTAEECKKSAHRAACRGFFAFIKEYKEDGCTQ